jgi:hypothetical protein
MSKEIIAKLEKIVNKELHQLPEKGVFSIIESDPKATCEKFTFRKENFTTFVFSMDIKRKKGAGDAIFPFLNSSEPNICSKNDGTLITFDDNKIYVFLFELKSSKDLDYLSQLKSGRDFVNYLFAILNTHCNMTVQLNFFGLRVLPAKKSARKKGTGRQKFQFQDRQGLQVADYYEPHRTLSLIDLLESAEQISS